MLLDVLMLLAGSAGLYFGAEWLVRGTAGLAHSFGIRPLIVGLTVVAYGTSAPELVVSCGAAFDGRGDLVLGNIIGSNIANFGLILGVTALISPPRVEGGLIYRELPVLVLSAAAVPLLLWDGSIGRFESGLLFAASCVFTFYLVRSSRQISDPAVAVPPAEPPVYEKPSVSRLALAAWSVLGLAVLLVAGKAFVDGAVSLALGLGMSEFVVGLTIVAIGTSLPEMAASLVAALRGHSAIAVGNVVGSNIFNVLVVLGAAGLIRPIAGSNDALRIDLVLMAVLTGMAVLFLRTERVITRTEGGLLVAVYLAFLVLLMIR
ncbi:MAG: calcium/sodium antiporter [Acidobacteria bacterium]|nr:calcium/sodium antiporter [Acidobacteriota bacterium]